MLRVVRALLAAKPAPPHSHRATTAFAPQPSPYILRLRVVLPVRKRIPGRRAQAAACSVASDIMGMFWQKGSAGACGAAGKAVIQAIRTDGGVCAAICGAEHFAGT
ncbi:hypothetical protein JCM14124_04000 [Humidesulfovibrio idahonensis]